MRKFTVHVSLVFTATCIRSVEDTQKWEEFKLIEFTPKPMGEHDVDIKIEFCGVCGSDVHTITGGWGKVDLVSYL